MNIQYVPKEKLFPAAINNLKNTEIVLDIGCGIRPQKMVVPRVHICCEPFAQYVDKLLEIAKEGYDRSYVVIRATWEEALRIIPEKSIDSVFLLDVIEHIEKTKAQELLKITEKIARGQVVIFTPLGFVSQHCDGGKDGWGMDGGIWQEHKSGWLPRDFDDTWNIIAAREYHTHNNAGQKYKKPYGAFFAIKDTGNHAIYAKNKIAETSESLVLAKEREFKFTQNQISILQKEINDIHVSRAWRIISFLRRLKESIPFLDK